MRYRRFHPVIFILVLLASIPFSSLSCSSEEPVKKEDEPAIFFPDGLRIRLQYFPGTADGPDCMRTTLFFMPSDTGGRQPDISFKLKRPGDRFAFETASNGSFTPLTADVTVVSAPVEGEKILVPGTEVVWTFRLEGPGKPSPGSRIRTLFRKDKQALVSNTVTVPDLPETRGTFFRLQRQARIASVLGDTKELFRLSELLIQERPDAFAGWWFQSIALEQSKKPGEALKAARDAVKRLPSPDAPAPGGRGHVDLSGEIDRRINRLRKMSIDDQPSKQ